MKFAVVFLVFLITCLTANAMLRRSLHTPAKEGRRKGAYRLLPNLRTKDIPKLRIPNKELCDELKLDPAQHYVVMPWWHQFCQEYKEQKSRTYNSKYPNLQFYVDALKRVNAAKKARKQKYYNKF